MAFTTMKPYSNPYIKNLRKKPFRTPILIDILLLTALLTSINVFSLLSVQDDPLYQNQPIASSSPQILTEIGVIEEGEEYEITAYCLSGIMANGKEVHNGAIACPAYMPLGTKLKIDWPGFINGEFVCEDRMGLKYRNGKYLDVWVADCDIAINFGRRKLLVQFPSSNK